MVYVIKTIFAKSLWKEVSKTGMRKTVFLIKSLGNEMRFQYLSDEVAKRTFRGCEADVGTYRTERRAFGFAT